MNFLLCINNDWVLKMAEWSVKKVLKIRTRSSKKEVWWIKSLIELIDQEKNQALFSLNIKGTQQFIHGPCSGYGACLCAPGMPGTLVPQGRQALRVQPVRKDPRDNLETEARKGNLEQKARRAPRDLWGIRVQWAQEELKETLAIREVRALKG